MRTIIINKSDINNNSRLEETVCEIMNRENQDTCIDFQVSEEEAVINDYRNIIEYNNEEETSFEWSIVDTSYNEDGTIYSVDLDC